MNLSDCVEVAEMRSWRRVNLYLDAGYRIVTVQTVHFDSRAEAGKQPQLTRGLIYVLGRTADVAHYDLPSRSQGADASGTDTMQSDAPLEQLAGAEVGVRATAAGHQGPAR